MPLMKEADLIQALEERAKALLEQGHDEARSKAFQAQVLAACLKAIRDGKPCR